MSSAANWQSQQAGAGAVTTPPVGVMCCRRCYAGISQPQFTHYYPVLSRQTRSSGYRGTFLAWLDAAPAETVDFQPYGLGTLGGAAAGALYLIQESLPVGHDVE